MPTSRVMGARANVQVQREAEALAQRTVSRRTRHACGWGCCRPSPSSRPRPTRPGRHDEVIRAENLLEVSRQQLAQLCFYRPDGTFVPRTLEPVEYEGIEEVRADLDETLDVALRERPEIHASSKGVQARQINERIASNAAPAAPRSGRRLRRERPRGQESRARRAATTRHQRDRSRQLAQFLGPGRTSTPVYGAPRGHRPSPFAGTGARLRSDGLRRASTPTTSASSSPCRSTTRRPRRTTRAAVSR